MPDPDGAPREPEPTPKPPPAVTVRALIVGVVAVVGLSVVSVHCTLGLIGSLASWDYFLETAFAFLLATIALSALAGLLWRRLKLRRAELAVVFIMLLAAAPIPSIGFVTRLIPALGGLRYYASAENRWEKLLGPHVSEWIAPKEFHTVRALMDGLGEDERIPWGAWTKPFVFWGGFFLAFALLSVCLAVIFRRQWMERERLAYPIMGVGLAMLDPPEGEHPIWRDRLLWIGIGLAFLFLSLSPLSRYSERGLQFAFRPWRFDMWWRTSMGYPLLRFKWSWAIAGLTYLIPQDVSLSCWLFSMLIQFQNYAYNHLGMVDAATRERYVWGGALSYGQAVGVFLFVGVSSFWLGRRHLGAVLRRAFGRGDADDSGEILPYRWACWGVLLPFVAMWVLMVAVMGCPVLLAPLILLVVVFCMVAISKIVIQCGFGWVNVPMPPTTMITSLLGVKHMAASTIASLAPNWIWTSPMRTTDFGTVSHGLKVAGQMRLGRRGLLFAIFLAIGTALVAGVVFHMIYAHLSGGLNFYRWFYVGYAKMPWEFAARKMVLPHGPRWAAMWTAAGGAGAAGVMQIMRNHFVWWPFSVVGLAGAHLATTRKFWFTVFLVWLFKGSLIRYGGQRAYRKMRPLFIGFFLGQIFSQAIWYVMYLITGVRGGVRW